MRDQTPYYNGVANHVRAEGIENKKVILSYQQESSDKTYDDIMPTLTVTLMTVGMVAVWGLIHTMSFVFKTSYIDVIYKLGLNINNPTHYEYITSIFVHGGFFHLLVNSIVFISFGGVLHRHMKNTKMYILYFIGVGVIANMVQVNAFQLAGISQNIPIVGASGALCALFAYFSLAKPRSSVLMFFFVKMKAKNAMAGFLLFSVLLVLIGGFGVGGVAHSAHITGLVCGILTAVYFDETPDKLPILDADYLGPLKSLVNSLSFLTKISTIR
jgi:membrane associated rhomboid family serine protease